MIWLGRYRGNWLWGAEGTIDNEPWFVGKYVATALGYSNSRKALADHVQEDDKGVTKCDTLGGKQDLTIINESGLYATFTDFQNKQISETFA